MTDNDVLAHSDGEVLILTLNRPEVMNALSPQMVAQLHEELRRADQDESVRAIVLTGEGAAFSAGYDMGARKMKADTSEETLRRWWDKDFGDISYLQEMMGLSKPVIAAVNGWCLGGGLWYALAADVTFAGESAVFGQPEVRHISNTTILFAALCGWKNAHRYGLTGDHFDAAEAMRIGVVNDVVTDDHLLEKSTAYAKRVAQVPAASVRVNKAITSMGLEVMGLRAAMRLNGTLSAIAHASGDSHEVAGLVEAKDREGMRGFLKARDTPFRPEPGGPRSDS